MEKNHTVGGAECSVTDRIHERRRPRVLRWVLRLFRGGHLHYHDPHKDHKIAADYATEVLEDPEPEVQTAQKEAWAAVPDRTLTMLELVFPITCGTFIAVFWAFAAIGLCTGRAELWRA